MKRIALFPGSFDPVTSGHIDLIHRSHRLFDHLIIAIGYNVSKNSLFSPEERQTLINESLSGVENISTMVFTGLVTQLARESGACAIIRGVRGCQDLDYEMRMATMNHALNNDVETLFLTSNPNYAAISSHLIKEIALSGGDIRPFVPEVVADALQHKIKS
ncbi:pantetheine-phosphate adenylyltransferase [Magnetococcales bacterium HHB-1]